MCHQSAQTNREVSNTKTQTESPASDEEENELESRTSEAEERHKGGGRRRHDQTPPRTRVLEINCERKGSYRRNRESTKYRSDRDRRNYH